MKNLDYAGNSTNRTNEESDAGQSSELVSCEVELRKVVFEEENSCSSSEFFKSHKRLIPDELSALTKFHRYVEEVDRSESIHSKIPEDFSSKDSNRTDLSSKGTSQLPFSVMEEKRDITEHLFKCQKILEKKIIVMSSIERYQKNHITFNTLKDNLNLDPTLYHKVLMEGIGPKTVNISKELSGLLVEWVLIECCIRQQFPGLNREDKMMKDHYELEFEKILDVRKEYDFYAVKFVMEKVNVILSIVEIHQSVKQEKSIFDRCTLL